MAEGEADESEKVSAQQIRDRLFEQLVVEARAGVTPHWDQGDVLTNCLSMILPVFFTVLVGPPFGWALIAFIGPLGALIWSFGGSTMNSQIGRSLMIGFGLGMAYIAALVAASGH